MQISNGLTPDRERAMKLRAILVLAAPAPEVQTECAWHWITPMPDYTGDELTWVIDGSKRFGATDGTATTGCGVTVIGRDGSLIAAARATLPPWIKTSYAAEVWASTSRCARARP